MNFFKSNGGPSIIEAFKAAQDTDIVGQVFKFIKDWTDFMNVLRRQLVSIENKLVSIENKLETVDNKVTLLVPETSISPEMQVEVFEMSRLDPRNLPSME